MTDKYGQAPAPMTLGELFAQPTVPPELRVVKHLVGYSEITLENGDLIRMHLHVASMEYDPQTACYNPSFRVIPEVIKRGWGGCEPLQGPLS